MVCIDTLRNKFLGRKKHTPFLVSCVQLKLHLTLFYHIIASWQKKAVKNPSVFELLTVLAVNFHVTSLDLGTLSSVLLKISYICSQKKLHVLLTKVMS